jgi:MoaD family protein
MENGPFEQQVVSEYRIVGNSLRVKICYFASVREVVNMREETIDVPPDTNVRKLIDLIAEKHGNKLKGYLLDANGNPYPYLQFILNEKSIAETGGLSTPLTDGCTFAIIPPVGGG